MPFPPSGSLLFKDDYLTIYEIVWETIEYDGVSLLDFTTVIKQPYVWGQPDEGRVENKIVYRRGICSTIRQVMEPNESGYTIVAEGGSQLICTFPTVFRCGDVQPLDPFIYHLAGMPYDDFTELVISGSRYTDPDIDLPATLSVVNFTLQAYTPPMLALVEFDLLTESPVAARTLADEVVWPDVALDGSVTPIPGKQMFEWVDVWPQ